MAPASIFDDYSELEQGSLELSERREIELNGRSRHRILNELAFDSDKVDVKFYASRCRVTKDGLLDAPLGDDAPEGAETIVLEVQVAVDSRATTLRGTLELIEDRLAEDGRQKKLDELREELEKRRAEKEELSRIIEELEREIEQ